MNPRDHSELARSLLASPHVSPATRAALSARIGPPAPWPDPGLFTDAQRRTLTAVADRLIPALDDAPRPDLAKAFEYRVSSPQGKGWRYATLPVDVDTHRRMLDLIEQQADTAHGRPFRELPATDQDALLGRLQAGPVTSPPDPSFDTPRAFEEILAALTECYASDPAVLVSLGYVGFADLPLWERTGLNQRDDREISATPSAIDG